MNFNYIDKVGVEIEGGWDVAPPGGPVGHDGSVMVAAPIRGEMRSRPLARWDTIESYVTANWPTHTDRTCGFHVHVSLRSTHLYASLMDKRFYDFFLARMESWGKTHDIQNSEFWNRLRGDNSFCRKAWNPDKQADATYKDSVRYAHWNFCYLQHTTAECRLLPTFKKPHVAVKAIREVLSIVEEWLDKAPDAVEVVAVLED